MENSFRSYTHPRPPTRLTRINRTTTHSTHGVNSRARNKGRPNSPDNGGSIPISYNPRSSFWASEIRSFTSSFVNPPLAAKNFIPFFSSGRCDAVTFSRRGGGGVGGDRSKVRRARAIARARRKQSRDLTHDSGIAHSRSYEFVHGRGRCQSGIRNADASNRFGTPREGRSGISSDAYPAARLVVVVVAPAFDNDAIVQRSSNARTPRRGNRRRRA